MTREPKIFSCDVCDIDFDTKTTLLCHISRVHKHTKYFCETCDRILLSQRLLLEHNFKSHGIKFKFLSWKTLLDPDIFHGAPRIKRCFIFIYKKNMYYDYMFTFAYKFLGLMENLYLET